MKKILLIVSALLFINVLPAHATPEPSIAIIDTGVNTDLFKNNIVAEYCVLEYSFCPNGQSTMEGPGAANLSPLASADFNHGSQMASIVLQVNPNAKIIPIRIAGMTFTGWQTIYTNKAVKMALDWVIANQETYNIKVVNVSQGVLNAKCVVPAGMAEDVAALKAKGVSVVSSTGNDYVRVAMNAIACLPDVISVGATDNPDKGTAKKAWDPTAKPYIAKYSNGNAKTTYYTNGRWYVTTKNGATKFSVGTSNASAALAAYLLTNPNPETTIASNEWLTGRYVNIQ